MLFLHGAGDPTQEDGSFAFLNRLATQFGLKQTDVIAPTMPNPETPDAADWMQAISSHLELIGESSVVMTHSLGGSCALQAFAHGASTSNVAQLILVAAPHWGKDPDWSAQSFMLPPRYSRTLRSIDAIDLVYSSDDEVVPIQHMYKYLEEIPCAKGYEVQGADHSFTRGDLAVFATLLEA